MRNCLYLETRTSLQDYELTFVLKIPVESFISYFIYKFCRVSNVDLVFVHIEDNNSKKNSAVIEFSDESIQFANRDDIPWQVVSSVYPVIFYEDTIITGLCAVSRHVSKYRSLEKCPQEHNNGLLGFRKNCLQAPNEVSIWTKFCEVDILKTVAELLEANQLEEIPKNLFRFENHLNKPVKIHNVFKIAKDLEKETNESTVKEKQEKNEIKNETRLPKYRKWKSSPIKKCSLANTQLKIQDLHLTHKFAEGPFLTLADLVLLPSYFIIVNLIGENVLKSYFPLTCKWFSNMNSIQEIQNLKYLTNLLPIKSFDVNNLKTPVTEDISQYKSDLKRHNPKRKIFTKPEDIENALSSLSNGMELNISRNELKNMIQWDTIPEGASPFAGHLPHERTQRKSEQLQNLTLAVLEMAKDNNVIVDFCSGGGHLGILIAYLLPKTTIILLDNKEHSLLRARKRVHAMGLKNVYFFQCNLDFFIGKFDIGVALHACGIASDLVLDKCLEANAKFVICPCCYGSLHATDRLAYPRSLKFKNLNIEQYLCISHAADQTHKDHPLTIRGGRCMGVIDSDRARLAEEYDYQVTLSKLYPLTCTDKNNLLIGVPF